MRIELEPSLDRWVEARILDHQQADRIRQFESTQIPRRRARWPVIVAVAFGGIMLAAGVLLFVSAHWDELSPFQRMVLLVLATVTADGRPLVGPVDGYFLHGRFHFTSGRTSVRMRHLALRPSVSASHLPGEELAVTVHGRAQIFELSDAGGT